MAKKQIEQTEIEAPYELPEGWKWCRLGDFINIFRGVSYKKEDAHTEKLKNDCLIMRGGNIIEGNIDLESDNIYVDKSLVSKNQYIKKYDVIIVTSTGSSKVIGRAGISYSDYSDVAFGAFLTLARPNNLAYKPYIDQYFQSSLYRERIRELASGVNINNIRTDYITDSPIPLPPTLEEQQRIVNRIETLFAKLDQAKEKAQNVVDTFETRKASILHKAFTGELTKKWRKERIDNGELISDNWNEKTLEECGKWERGRSKHRPRNAPELFGGNYPFIQTGDVANAEVYINEHKQTLSEFGFKQSRLFPAGTLCITIAANIGKVAILSYDCCFPDSVVGFSPNENNDSKFMYYKINEIEKELEELAPATAQKNLNLKLLTSVNLKVPTLSEQQEIVRILDCVLEKENQAKEAAIAVLEQIDLLKKSILARAFRGEL